MPDIKSEYIENSDFFYNTTEHIRLLSNPGDYLFRLSKTMPTKTKRIIHNNKNTFELHTYRVYTLQFKDKNNKEETILFIYDSTNGEYIHINIPTEKKYKTIEELIQKKVSSDGHIKINGIVNLEKFLSIAHPTLVKYIDELRKQGYNTVDKLINISTNKLNHNKPYNYTIFRNKIGMRMSNMQQLRKKIQKEKIKRQLQEEEKQRQLQEEEKQRQQQEEEKQRQQQEEEKQRQRQQQEKKNRHVQKQQKIHTEIQNIYNKLFECYNYVIKDPNPGYFSRSPSNLNICEYIEYLRKTKQNKELQELLDRYSGSKIFILSPSRIQTELESIKLRHQHDSFVQKIIYFTVENASITSKIVRSTNTKIKQFGPKLPKKFTIRMHIASINSSNLVIDSYKVNLRENRTITVIYGDDENHLDEQLSNLLRNGEKLIELSNTSTYYNRNQGQHAALPWHTEQQGGRYRIKSKKHNKSIQKTRHYHVRSKTKHTHQSKKSKRTHHKTKRHRK